MSCVWTPARAELPHEARHVRSDGLAHQAVVVEIARLELAVSFLEPFQLLPHLADETLVNYLVAPRPAPFRRHLSWIIKLFIRTDQYTAFLGPPLHGQRDCQVGVSRTHQGKHSQNECFETFKFSRKT